jgi:hypothetical protein
MSKKPLPLTKDDYLRAVEMLKYDCGYPAHNVSDVIEWYVAQLEAEIERLREREEIYCYIHKYLAEKWPDAPKTGDDDDLA